LIQTSPICLLFEQFICHTADKEDVEKCKPKIENSQFYVCLSKRVNEFRVHGIQAHSETRHSRLEKFLGKASISAQMLPAVTRSGFGAL
jgi:hypothetical protein